MTKVSIIIPVYNAEKYLQECLNSVLNQTYPEIEIIAVYEGFPDKSLEILQKYSKKIKIINKKSGNAAAAYNAGIKEAKGEWIKRLDVDDVLYPNAIEELILETKNLLDKKRTILYSNYDYIDSKGNVIDQEIEPNYNNIDSFDFNVLLLDHYIGYGSSSLIHKSTITEYGMFDETVVFEDYELWLRYCLLFKCRLHLVQKTLVKRRVHHGQITKARIGISLEQQEELKKSVLEKLNPSERKKYEIALKTYQKNKSLPEKSKFFVRYKLMKILPNTLSMKLIDFYWFTRSIKK